ncbi:MAG TPA: hypothetical protein VF458_09990 [Ktedonobacteraceae bacterium]
MGSGGFTPDALINTVSRRATVLLIKLNSSEFSLSNCAQTGGFSPYLNRIDALIRCEPAFVVHAPEHKRLCIVYTRTTLVYALFMTCRLHFCHRLMLAGNARAAGRWAL